MFSYVPDRVPAIPTYWEGRLHWPFAAPRTDQLRNVTAVCSQWRKLALGDSTLWSTFWESSNEFATCRSLDLFRCPAGPLHVFTEAKNPQSLIKFVCEHAPRIRQLHCFDSDHGATLSQIAFTLFDTLGTVDFGLLQHLCLPLILDGPCELPLVTSVTAATLRSLHMSSSSLPFQCFPSLTRFVFWYPRLANLGSPQIETRSLLRFLAGVPKLEVLHLLRLRIQSGAHESAEGARQVELCHLRYFTYESDPKDVDIPSLTHLLSHIRTPVHCYCINVDEIVIDENESSDGMHALVTQILGRRNRRRSTLYLLCDSAPHSCTQAVLEIQPEASEDTGGARIRIVFDYTDAAVSQSLDSFLSLSLGQVEEFRISVSGSRDTTSGIIARIWPKLANVRNLAVSLWWPFNNGEYLGPLHDMLEPLRSSERPPVCPRLEALDMYVPVCEDPFMAAIGQTLASRTEAGFPVRRLAVYAGRFTYTTDTSVRCHVTHFDASRSYERSIWEYWPLLKSSSPANSLPSSHPAVYDPIGADWSTLEEEE